MAVSLTPALSPRARGIRSALRATFTVTGRRNDAGEDLAHFLLTRFRSKRLLRD
jgi:hypothetical protein